MRFSLLSKISTHEFDLQNFDHTQSFGVSPTELKNKLSHLLIEQQENQIVGLESELHSAHSKLNEKETELQALKDCIKRLTEFSLSAASGKKITPTSILHQINHSLPQFFIQMAKRSRSMNAAKNGTTTIKQNVNQ